MTYQLLKPYEIALVLGISRSLVYRLLRTGEIRTVKIGRCARVRPEDLDAFLDEHTIKQKPLKEWNGSDN